MKQKRIISLLLSLAVMLSLFASFTITAGAAENVAEVIGASGTSNTFTAFQEALDYADSNDTVKILKDITYSASITKKLNIIVQNGATFNVRYLNNNGVQVMEPSITVESGATVKFTRYRVLSDFCYLVMNGDMTIKDGATVTMAKQDGLGGDRQSGVLFMGKFVNKGTLNCGNDKNENGVPYIKYGEEAGTITTGFPIYNMCIKTPSAETITEKAVRITSITGKAEYGEKLTAEIDGFGNSANLPEALKKLVRWYSGETYKGDSYKNVEYTVEKGDIGKTISAVFLGIYGGTNYLTKVFPYCYILYKDGEVISITNGKTGVYVKTEVVPEPDLSPATVYLGGENASDENDGKSAETAVASFKTAVDLVADGGEVIVCGDVTIPSNYNFIRKGIAFKAQNENVKPAFKGGTYTTASYIVANSSTENKNLSFTGIKFEGIVVFAAIPSGVTLSFDEVQTAEGGVMTALIYTDYGFAAHDVNIKDSNDLMFDIDVIGATTSHIVTIDNSSITSDSEGSLGNVKLLNGSTLSTTQPVQTLTADNTSNKIILTDGDDGKVLPIKIEGDVTIGGTSIELVYSGSLTNGDKLVSSSSGNTALTTDKFKITKAGVSLKQQGNDVVASVEENEEYTIDYKNDKAEIYVPTAGSYTVIFVDYENGAINKIVTSPLTVTADKIGTNSVTPEGITLGNGDKIMLWSSLYNMIPLANVHIIE